MVLWIKPCSATIWKATELYFHLLAQWKVVSVHVGWSQMVVEVKNKKYVAKIAKRNIKEIVKSTEKDCILK